MTASLNKGRRTKTLSSSMAESSSTDFIPPHCRQSRGSAQQRSVNSGVLAMNITENPSSRMSIEEPMPPIPKLINKRSFLQSITVRTFTPGVMGDMLEKPTELDVDDTLMRKILIILEDLRSLQCTDFWRHLCDAVMVLVTGYKALILFALCSLLVIWMDDIQDQLVNQRDRAQAGFEGQVWFILIIIVISITKSLSAPASKSIITFCLTVLFHVNINSHVSRAVLTIIVFVTDWMIDIAVSTSQVHFAAAKFSRSLFLLLRIWVQVFSVIHPIFFVAWIVFQVAYFLPGGTNLFIQGLYASPFALWSILHILYKTKLFRCLFFITVPKNMRNILIIPDRYVNESNMVLLQWSCIFDKYQDPNNKWSVMHGILRVMKLCGYCSCCVENGSEDGADKQQVDVIWNHEKHALLKTFLPAWLWVYTAEFVLMLDAVFLVPYSWFRYYGLFMIGAVTMCDIDRYFTIKYTLEWLDGGDFEDSVKELVWFKIIKQPFGQLLGCVHVYLIWQKTIRQALYGPEDLQAVYVNKKAELDKKKRSETETENVSDSNDDF